LSGLPVKGKFTKKTTMIKEVSLCLEEGRKGKKKQKRREGREGKE
jgi:hypothetical protein